MNLSQLFPKDLFHSYVVEGDPEELPYLLHGFLEERGDVEKKSPDTLIQIYDAFGIQDSGKIKEWHQNKAIGGNKKMCIIGAKFINREAEQSLLKMIEEPNSGTHFFLVVPDSSLLADTILSRVHIIKNIEVDFEKEDKMALEFWKLSPSIRIEKIGEIIKEFKDEENSGGLRYKAISLINATERIVYDKWKKDLNNEDTKFVLEELKNCRSFLSTPGASVKMILEHIALII